MFKNEYVGPEQTLLNKSKLTTTLTPDFYNHSKAPNYDF